MAAKVLVLGSNFAGLTAALAVKHELQDDVEVTVVSKDDRFIFNPSFIWIPFGRRKPADITFPVAPTFETHGVEFVHAEATRIDPQHQQVQTTNGSHGYDYLVIATGYLEDFSPIPGAGPGGPAHAITSLAGAVAAAEGWQRLLADPGPVVVAAAQGTGCFGAAYEFVFNLAYQLRRHGLKQRAPISLCDRRAVPGPLRDRRAARWGAAAGHVPQAHRHPGRPRHRHRRGRAGRAAAGRWPPAAVPLRGGGPAVRGRRGRADLGPGQRQRVCRGPGHLPDQGVPEHLRGRDRRRR